MRRIINNSLINYSYIKHSIIITLLYFFLRNKVNIYWINNDFKDIFPEVFYPWRLRYERSENNDLFTSISSLKYDIKENIVENRKSNKK